MAKMTKKLPYSFDLLFDIKDHKDLEAKIFELVLIQKQTDASLSVIEGLVKEHDIDLEVSVKEMRDSSLEELWNLKPSE